VVKATLSPAGSSVWLACSSALCKLDARIEKFVQNNTPDDLISEPESFLLQ